MTNILKLAETGNAANLLRDLRVRSLYSSYFFTKVVLNYPRLTDYFHQKEMDYFLDNWSAGVTKQLIKFPRGFYKSTCFTIGTSMWVVLPPNDNDTDYAIDALQIPEELWFERIKLHDQNARQLLAFENDENATKKIIEIKSHFENNEIFRACFPEIAKRGDEPTWNNSCLIIQRTGNEWRHAEGTFESIGVKGALQSRHYHIVWEDDLVGEKARDSDTVMQDTIGWHTRLHGAFVDATRQVRFVIGNTWSFNDLNAYIEKNEKEFVIHSVGAYYQGEDGKETPTFPIDGTKEVRFTMEALMLIKKNMRASDFACQYMNVPTLDGDREVNLDLLHYYTVESGQICCSCGFKCYPESLNVYLSYDPYNAKRTSVSCPALAVVGTAWDKHLFLLDYFVKKGSYKNIFDKIFEYNDRWRPKLFTYEDVGNQNMAEHHIKEMERTKEHKEKWKRGMPRILPVPPKGKADEIRIRDYLLPYLATGKFSCRKAHAAFISQLETYPVPVADHDYDLLAALAQGATVWRFPFGEDDLLRDKNEDTRILEALKRPYSVQEARL